MNELFSNKVSPEFIPEVGEITYKLGTSIPDLMFVMDYETAGTFSPSIQHPGSKATGLIGFLPSTAIGLGTTVEELAKKSAVQQLPYVYEYLKPYKGKMEDVYGTYLAVFYPAALGKPDTYVFPQNVVNSNPSFFKTGSTLADFKKGIQAIIYERVPVAYHDQLLKKKEIFYRYTPERLSLAA